MRTISSDGLAKLAAQYGNEPICIVEIDWYPGATTMSYADRDIPGPPAVAGKIIELGNLDNVVDLVLTNGSSTSISLTLDDTDGIIKSIYNQYDLHKRSVRVYQWFEGLALSDKFLIFAGKINTPVSWNERDRTVKLNVLSHIEDQEVGFSPEAGEFPWLPSAMCGKAWPMIFGTVQDCPTVQITRVCQAVTLTPVGILSGQQAFLGAPIYENGTNQDVQKNRSLAMLQIQANVIMEAADCWLMEAGGGPGSDTWIKAQELLNQWASIMARIADERAKSLRKETCIQLTRRQLVDYNLAFGADYNPIQTLGGEDFPQNTPIWINIGGGSFFGHFEGNLFYVTERVNIDDAVQIATDIQLYNAGNCPPEPGRTTYYDFHQTVPCDSICALQNNAGNFGNAANCEVRQYGYITSPPVANVRQAGTSNYMKLFWKEGGQTVTLESAQAISYVASIVPGEVLCVKAFKQYDGPRILTTVPTDYYTVSNVNYGNVDGIHIAAVLITVNRQLSTYKYSDGTNQGWSNELYVTFKSSVGPDTIDVIKYLISTYAISHDTALTWDDASFNYCKTKLLPFPVNFALLEQKNIVEVLKDIAFQCRCALWLSDNTFYMRYLPEEPVSPGDPAWTTTPQNRVVDTITVSDMDSEVGVEVGYTPTENLVTKMKIAWRISLAPDDPFPTDSEKHEQTMVLRHNVARYGVHEKSFNWYIYNQPDIIMKCATFWLIRLSTTWKTLKFRTFLNKLNLEMFDTILFDDTVGGVGKGYAASTPIKAVITKADYASTDDYINFECELPVKAGEMVQYPFYWPSKLPANVSWPPADEIASGDAGGGGIGVWASGNLPIGVIGGAISGQTIFVGGPNVVFGPNSDRGDPSPTDIGFTAQSVLPENSITRIPSSTQPQANLAISFLREENAIEIPQQPVDISLDLYKTVIVKRNGDGTAVRGYLGDFFNIGKSNGLRMELAVAQAIDNRGGDTPLATSGTDAKFQDIFTLGSDPGGGPAPILMLDATGNGIMAITDDAPNGAEIDFKYDSDGDKVGIGTAFLQS